MKPKHDTVRDLIPSVTKLARHLGVTSNAVYRWIKVDRIPTNYLIPVANFYDIDIPMHLAESSLKNGTKLKLKPPETLPTALEVLEGKRTLEDAAAALQMSPKAIKLILTYWGPRLRLLIDTLRDVEEERISLDDAAATLGVTKFNVHALRRKYGLRPAPRPKPAPKPIVARKKRSRQAALLAIEGKLTLEQAAEQSGQSWRTIHRWIDKLSPDLGLIELTRWSKTFRKAYVDEIERDLPKKTPKLFEFGENAGFLSKKSPKYPKTPENWRKVTLKRLMIAVLTDEMSLEAVAAARHADPVILETLFSGDLKTLDLSWDEVLARPVSFQLAVAELLIGAEAKWAKDKEKAG